MSLQLSSDGQELILTVARSVSIAQHGVAGVGFVWAREAL